MRALISLLVCVSLPALAADFNDTGITFCGDDITNVADCATVGINGGSHPRQDARYGRDAAATAGQFTKVGGGEAGFDFTALDVSGLPTTPGSGATPHPCTRDNVTGLVWEVKSADGGSHDQKWTYSWYDSVYLYNGYQSYTTNCKTSGRCDTEKFVADVNASALCSFSDWRMPTTNELQGIVHYGRITPAIDPLYFPNTPSSSFWSGSPSYDGNTYYDSSDRRYHYFLNSAWYVNFDNGSNHADNQYKANHVRLVHGSQ